MTQVTLARHLYAFFPALEGRELHVQADTAAQVVAAVEAIAPGFASYICDERGNLRPHVNIFIGEDLVRDRKSLSDKVTPESRVFILQALSGG